MKSLYPNNCSPQQRHDLLTNWSPSLMFSWYLICLTHQTFWNTAIFTPSKPQILWIVDCLNWIQLLVIHPSVQMTFLFRILRTGTIADDRSSLFYVWSNYLNGSFERGVRTGERWLYWLRRMDLFEEVSWIMKLEGKKWKGKVIHKYTSTQRPFRNNESNEGGLLITKKNLQNVLAYIYN